MKFPTVYSLLLVPILSGCSDPVTGPDNTNGSSQNTPVGLQGSIDTDSLLRNIQPDSTRPDYRIRGDLAINAKLTIEPGVIIDVDATRALTINTGGSISAVGTDSLPIVIRGTEQTQGYWRGIRIISNSRSNEFSRVRIEHAGSSGFTGAGIRTAVAVAAGGRVALRHSIIRGSGGHGLHLESATSVLEAFEVNLITANAQVPVFCRVAHYRFLDSASSYTGNGTDLILAHYLGVDSDITGSHVWQPLNVPYTFEGVDQRIAGSVTVLPGVGIRASQNAGIIVASTGSFSAKGEADRPVVIAGRENVRGYWRGLNILSNSNENRLEHVVLANGGSAGFDGQNHKTNLILGANARIAIKNSTVRTSGGFGIFAAGEGAALPGFERNTITDNEAAPVRVRVEQFRFLDTASSFTGNGRDRIEAYHQFSWRNLSGDHVWQALAVPYHLPGPDPVHFLGAVVISPGAVIHAAQGAGIQVESGGSLNAVGSSQARIEFRGDQDVPGVWRGLRFVSNSPQNVFNHTIISNGGGSGFDGANRKANIELAIGSRLSISNSTLSSSGGVGIRNQGGVLVQTGLEFLDNVDVDIVP